MKDSKNTIEEGGAYHTILAYLAESPDAQDTLEGITEWWVLHQRLRFEVNKVTTTLSQLIKEGFILEERLLDGSTIYKVNRQMLTEIRAILGRISQQNDKGTP